MGNQSVFTALVKKIKHTNKNHQTKNINEDCDKGHEKVNQFLEIINCYSNIKDKSKE